MTLTALLTRHAQGVAVCAATILTLSASAARAGAPPDSVHLGALRSAVASGALIGISTSRYELLRRHVTVDESFVTVPRAGRPALVMAGALETGVERRIPWADIEGVSEVHPRGTIGFVIGGLVGGALGGAFVGTNGPDLFEKGDHGAVSFGVLLAAVGATTGMVLGLASPARHPLYP